MATGDHSLVPTKGNLIQVKKSLELAKMGYDLLDRKRNILIRELLMLVERAKSIRGKISDTYSSAYFALQKANITLGICEDIAQSVPIEDGIDINYRSVMGVEIPMVNLDCPAEPVFSYGMLSTNSQLDKAYLSFHKVKVLTAKLAEIENSVYRLANAIKKTQGRANALKNIIIPKFEGTVKYITDALEEKEREDFSRLKVIKSVKERQAAARQ